MNNYSVANIFCSAKQYENAYGFFEKGASLGDKKCNFGLAYCYFNGYFVDKDINKAIEIVSQIYDDILNLASNDDKEAMCILAYCFQTGFFTEIDDNLAQNWLKKSRQPISDYKNLINDYFIVSRYIFENYKNNIVSEFSINDLFQVAMLGCMVGDTRCLYYLSICYKNGFGTECNISEFESISDYLKTECERLANSGDKFAMYLLYLIYFDSEFNKINLDKSKSWLIKSACFGDDFSKYEIAMHILNDEDVLFLQNDKNEAIEWLNSSARLGNAFAIKKLEELEQDVFYYTKFRLNNNIEIKDETNKRNTDHNEICVLDKCADYLNNLNDINNALLWVNIYKKCKKNDIDKILDCEIYKDKIFEFYKISSFSRSVLGLDICKYFEDYLKLNDCLLGVDNLIDELYNCCKNRIDYEKKPHFFGLIKVTSEFYTIKMEETINFLNLKQYFLNRLENNIFDESKKLCKLLNSISVDLKNLGKEENLQLLLEFSKNYVKNNNLSKIFYTAQFINKYGNVFSDSDDMWISPELSKKMAKKYTYFNPVFVNFSKIYASDICNLN